MKRFYDRACPHCGLQGEIWHLLEDEQGQHKCDCLCRNCWQKLSIAGRVKAYAAIAHHAQRDDWAWMAPAIWSGK